MQIKILTFVLKLLCFFSRQTQFVDMILKDGGPVLQLIHDVPRRGHAHAEQDGRFGEIGLGQCESEQMAVSWIPIQDPMTEPGVI